MHSSEYTPPILTVDSVIFQLIDKRLYVLLIKRTYAPFKDEWALPGGYNAAGETTTEAMRRVLLEKGGVNSKTLDLVEQLYTFDTVARDPRGHAVSVTYMGLGKALAPETSDTTQHPEFLPVDELPSLAFDHKDIVRLARERLQSKISYTNAVFALLPKHFTLTQLQEAYEAILGKTLDKRNFRKKFLAFDLIQETDEWFREGAHRPARLYQFKTQKLTTLGSQF
jgi:8-oxo-dGTP diphosphatase